MDFAAYSNFACKCREIDLIISNSDNFLVFVEAYYRRQTAYGKAAETETNAKQASIQKTSAYFLKSYRTLASPPCRFNVTAISYCNSTQEKIEWIESAFI